MDTPYDDEVYVTRPTLAQIKTAARVFSQAATALENAIGIARQIFEARWPMADETMENHLYDMFEVLLGEDREGAKWTVNELRELAADLEGPNRGEWVKEIEEDPEIV